MLMQVHDELVFEINENKIQESSTNIILPIMETANLPIVPLNVKLKVDVLGTEKIGLKLINIKFINT